MRLNDENIARRRNPHPPQPSVEPRCVTHWRMAFRVPALSVSDAGHAMRMIADFDLHDPCGGAPALSDMRPLVVLRHHS